MLPRVLEPEVMDTAEEAHDYDAMDHAAVNRVFVEDFLAAWKGHGLLLDVGTGTAQIPIELCRRAAGVQVVAIDLADEMLTVGRGNVHRAGLDDHIRLERVDAKAMPYADGQFAGVISNSIVHHIPEPGAVVAEMTRVVAPGGLLFVRDLLRPDSEAELRRLAALHAGAATGHQQKMFADSLHAALTLDEVRGLVEPLGFDPREVKQTSDRHWTWIGKKAV